MSLGLMSRSSTSVQTQALGRPDPTRRGLFWHSIFVVVWAALVSVVYFHYLTPGTLVSSDGCNYAAVARNCMEGRGLISGVIQPGLMTVVPTDRFGQAFVIQAPLWPYLLSQWYHVFGATSEATLALCYTLLCIATLLAWWICYLMAGNVWSAYLASAMLLTNPIFIGSVAAAYNVALQSVIVGALFLVMLLPPTGVTIVLAAAFMGLGALTRENSLFLIVGLAYCWYRHWPRRAEGSRLLARFDPRWLGALGFVGAFTVAMGLIESARKAGILGTWDAPTMRMTFLYWTKDCNLGWYFIYDYEGLKLRPLQYFMAHPGELVHKIWFQLWVLFLQQTVPALLSAKAWFVPVLLPWLLPAGRGRTLGIAFLLVLTTQTMMASLSFLHAHYYVAFLPIFYAVIAATIWAIGQRLPAANLGAKLGWSLIGAYALAPFLFNLWPIFHGVPFQTGELPITRTQKEKLTAAIRDNTPEHSVVVCSHSPLLAWTTQRTIMQYSGHPDYVISDSEMWRRIDRQVPIDFIVLTSLLEQGPHMKLLANFELWRASADDDIKIWLYRRKASE
jgi:hypothetical protein